MKNENQKLKKDLEDAHIQMHQVNNIIKELDSIKHDIFTPNDRLSYMFLQQSKFQYLLKSSIHSIEYEKLHILALHTELSELLQELHWKPWKHYAKPEDYNKIKEEIVDCWHFLINITLPYMTANELFHEFNKKHMINNKRQKDGY